MEQMPVSKKVLGPSEHWDQAMGAGLILWGPHTVFLALEHQNFKGC